MNRLCPRSWSRRARLLALGWLLLAGQLMALLHPLAHGAPAAGVVHTQGHAHVGHGDRDARLAAQREAHAGAQPDARGPAQADAACDLCLACAAAGHGAAAAPLALPAPVCTAAVAARRDEPAAAARAPWHRHNRGPPAAA